jgi:DNA-binding NarL/FixJ family response regulator
MRVLVADDSVAVFDRVTELLTEVEGIELVGQAGDIRETSRLIEQLHPDIVILDLQMPDGNGLDILAAIKGKHSESIVIVLTNSEAASVRERSLKTGADFFLDKSNESERLPQIVTGIVRTARTAPRPMAISPRVPDGKIAL